MFCSKCGNEVSEGAKFCANCGVQVGALVQATEEAKPSYLRSAFNSASHSIKSATTSALHAGDLVAHQIGDLNGDGKIDAEDFKIAAAKGKEIAAATASEVAKLGKEALHSNLVKEAAAGALVGGVVASAVPVLGTATGAALGAAVGAYKHITK